MFEWIRELSKIATEDNSYSVTWAKLFKRELFNVICFLKVKLIKNARINIKLFLEASRITYVHKGLYFYRIKGRTIIQTVTEKLLEDVLDTLEDRLCFVTMKGLYSDIYKNALLELLKFRSYRAYTGSLENTEIYRRYQEILYLH